LNLLSCLSLLSTGIIGVHHHTWLQVLFLKQEECGLPRRKVKVREECKGGGQGKVER
jgi:hypothetical protein